MTAEQAGERCKFLDGKGEHPYCALTRSGYAAKAAPSKRVVGPTAAKTGTRSGSGLGDALFQNRIQTLIRLFAAHGHGCIDTEREIG
jgi:hypothetical protein